MKKIEIADFKTIVDVYTNAQKLLYGSGKVGAGYVDQYYILKAGIRGKLTNFNGRRALANGEIVYEQMNKLLIRYDPDISNVLDLQMRFFINGKTYTYSSYKFNEEGRTVYIEFTLLKYGK